MMPLAIGPPDILGAEQATAKISVLHHSEVGVSSAPLTLCGLLSGRFFMNMKNVNLNLI